MPHVQDTVGQSLAAPKGGIQPVTIREFQEWTRRRDEATRWGAICPLQIMAHLTEEAGEVAKAINRIYEYRDETAESHRANLGSELVDVMWFLSKLASRYDIDLEDETRAMVKRSEERLPGTYRSQLAAAVESLSADANRARSSLNEDGQPGKRPQT